MSAPKNDPFSLNMPGAENYLLRLMLEDARRSLETEIIEAIRPRVREHVERAFLALKPQLEAAFNPAQRDMALRMTIRELPQ